MLRVAKSFMVLTLGQHGHAGMLWLRGGLNICVPSVGRYRLIRCHFHINPEAKVNMEWMRKMTTAPISKSSPKTKIALLLKGL